MTEQQQVQLDAILREGGSTCSPTPRHCGQRSKKP